MPQPNLIHRVTMILEIQDKAATEYDHDAREAIQRVTTQRISIIAQPSMMGAGRGIDKLDFSRGGTDEEGSVYVLFRYTDLQNHPDGPFDDFRPGTKVLQWGHLPVSLYFDRTQWMGHYEDTNGPTLLKCWVTDRAPTRPTRGT